MSFLSDILGTVGNAATSVGQGVGNIAGTVGNTFSNMFGGGGGSALQSGYRPADTSGMQPDWVSQNLAPASPADIASSSKVANATVKPGLNWGGLAKEATQTMFKNLKSSNMPPGMKGLATKKSGKYTPGLKGPDTPQGIRAVKGLEQEAFTPDKDMLSKIQKGLEERAKNRAAMAGYTRESSKYSDFMPAEGSSYEAPPESSSWTDEDWNKWLDDYYTGGYDKWSFMD